MDSVSSNMSQHKMREKVEKDIKELEWHVDAIEEGRDSVFADLNEHARKAPLILLNNEQEEAPNPRLANLEHCDQLLKPLTADNIRKTIQKHLSNSGLEG